MAKPENPQWGGSQVKTHCGWPLSIPLPPHMWIGATSDAQWEIYRSKVDRFQSLRALMGLLLEMSLEIGWLNWNVEGHFVDCPFGGRWVSNRLTSRGSLVGTVS